MTLLQCILNCVMLCPAEPLARASPLCAPSAVASLMRHILQSTACLSRCAAVKRSCTLGWLGRLSVGQCSQPADVAFILPPPTHTHMHPHIHTHTTRRRQTSRRVAAWCTLSAARCDIHVLNTKRMQDTCSPHAPPVSGDVLGALTTTFNPCASTWHAALPIASQN
jgi:hypothetical protein